MLHLVLLTKSYNQEDFNCWLNYHLKLTSNIHIIDNESTINVNDSRIKSYTKIEGWPDQYRLYDDILNNNRFDFKDNDYVLFLDDDEYLWYNNEKFDNIEQAITFYFKSLDSLLLPQILMSNKHFCKKRDKILPLFSTFRRNDFSSQGKSIIRFNISAKYKFKHNLVEQGHVPLINNIRLSDVVSNKSGTNTSKTTYGITGYDCDLRLYHYHIKSQEDWDIKFSRGSAAKQEQWYDKDITKNKAFGGYTVQDLTMYNSFYTKK